MYSGQLCKLYTFESVGSFHLHKGAKIPLLLRFPRSQFHTCLFLYDSYELFIQ